MRPPTRPSITTEATRSSPIEWLRIGHQVDGSSVNTRKARSTGHRTVIDTRMGSVVFVSCMAGPSLPPGPGRRGIRARFCRVPEPVERVAPQALDVPAKLGQSSGADVVQPPGTLLTIRHQARLLQDLEVLGDGGTADGDVGGNLTHRLRPASEQLEDRPPGGIAE